MEHALNGTFGTVEYSFFFTVNCRQMLASQAASVICLNLMSSNEILVFESVGILLNLIENCGDQASSQLCTIKCIT